MFTVEDLERDVQQEASKIGVDVLKWVIALALIVALAVWWPRGPSESNSIGHEHARDSLVVLAAKEHQRAADANDRADAKTDTIDLLKAQRRSIVDLPTPPAVTLTAGDTVQFSDSAFVVPHRVVALLRTFVARDSALVNELYLRDRIIARQDTRDSIRVVAYRDLNRAYAHAVEAGDEGDKALKDERSANRSRLIRLGVCAIAGGALSGGVGAWVGGTRGAVVGAAVGAVGCLVGTR